MPLALLTCELTNEEEFTSLYKINEDCMKSLKSVRDREKKKNQVKKTLDSHCSLIHGAGSIE